jgi:amino acid transporter
VATAREVLKRLVVGRPLRSDKLGETALPKWLALPVFCSDPLSSVAYATEEILLVLGAGGLIFLADAKWIAVAICALLVVVVLSYRQTVHAYPNGGGDYAVARANLGPRAGVFVATALLVDYVLTVAVSVVAGVAAITSAAPSLQRHRVLICVGFVVLLTLMNLRGLKESGKAFAIPTYGFVLSVYAMFVFAFYRLATGSDFVAESHDLPLEAHVSTGGWLTAFLLLRAFASGCTALTGVGRGSGAHDPRADHGGGLRRDQRRRLLHPAGVHGRDPHPRGQHRLQRLPDPRLDPGGGLLPPAPAAQPR